MFIMMMVMMILSLSLSPFLPLGVSSNICVTGRIFLDSLLTRISDGDDDDDGAVVLTD